MLLGLIRPNEGQIRLFGMAFEQNRMSALQRIGALVETPSFYPHLTGYENLEVTQKMLGIPREKITRALNIVALEQNAHRRVREYSLGMRQRLGLAFALTSEPKLIILDEPTNGLDPSGIHEIRDLLRRLPSEYGVTVFLSSHLLSEVEQVATHIGIVQQGRLLFQGTIGELQAQRQEFIRLGVEESEKALMILTNAGWSVQPDGDFLVVSAHGRTEAAKINDALNQHGVSIFHLAIEQPSLENIFLQLTNADNSQRS